MAPIMYPTRGIGASTQARIGYVEIMTIVTRNIMRNAESYKENNNIAQLLLVLTTNNR